MPDRCVDLVCGSPPYLKARTYGINADRDCETWIEWQLQCVAEAQRVCRGPVIWVCAGTTEDRCYQPGPEGLIYRWWKRGGDCQLYRPCYWKRSGIPGSGGDQWFRSTIEYVICFKRPGKLPYSDNKATGAPPKWMDGGNLSHRTQNGRRVNQWGEKVDRVKFTHDKEGNKIAQWKPRPSHHEASEARPAIANPGNFWEDNFTDEEIESLRILDIPVGGGLMGDDRAHLSEAPYPESLVERILKTLSKPGDIVYDPWCGSGTTPAVAERLGRVGWASDIRLNQLQIARERIEAQKQRMASPLFDEDSARKKSPAEGAGPSDGQLSLL